MEESCRLSSEFYMIPSSAEHHGLNRTRKVDMVSPFKLNLTDVELSSVTLLNKTKLYEDLMNLNNNKLPIRSLRNELKNLEKINKIRAVNTYVSTTGTTLGSISIIFIIILVVLIALYMKRSNENRIVYEHDLLTRLIRRQELANRSQTEERTLETTEHETAMEDRPSTSVMHSPAASIRKFGSNIEYRPSVTARSTFNMGKDGEESYRIFHEDPKEATQALMPSNK